MVPATYTMLITHIRARTRARDPLRSMRADCDLIAVDFIRYPLSELETQSPPYVLKLVRNYDEKVKALESGMAIRPITSVRRDRPEIGPRSARDRPEIGPRSARDPARLAPR